MSKTLAGRLTVRVMLVAALTLGMVTLASPAWAETFTVTNTNNSGDGSLRQAIEEANSHVGEDKIVFSPSLSGQTITLASGLPHIRDVAGLTIDGESADITISGNNTAPLFEVSSSLVSSAKLTLNNLTVANSSTHGIYNRGTLEVSNITLSGSSAQYRGGGIRNEGTATVSSSTLSGNTADITGGGIYNTGTLTVSNSTLSGNSAGEMGGGIHNTGTLTVSNSTLSDNRTVLLSLAAGNGIYNGGTATLKNTIMANSASGWNCSGNTITDGGYNLDSGSGCRFGTDNNSQSEVDALLGPLRDNGGPTTHALLEGSPAIDKGHSFGAATDQRGKQRPNDFPNIANAGGGDGSDIGAFEVGDPPETAITSGPSGIIKSTSATFSFTSNAAGSSFECSLNGADFSPCSSLHSYTNLKSVEYTFQVRAVDNAGGHADPTPAARSWTVDTIKAIVSGMSPRHKSIIRDTTPTIKAVVKDNMTNLKKVNMKLYVGGKLIPATKYSYSAATDKLTYNSPKLSKGKKTVKIVATDAAGNVGTKSWYFTIK